MGVSLGVACQFSTSFTCQCFHLASLASLESTGCQCFHLASLASAFTWLSIGFTRQFSIVCPPLPPSFCHSPAPPSSSPPPSNSIILCYLPRSFPRWAAQP